MPFSDDRNVMEERPLFGADAGDFMQMLFVRPAGMSASKF